MSGLNAVLQRSGERKKLHGSVFVFESRGTWVKRFVLVFVLKALRSCSGGLVVKCSVVKVQRFESGEGAHFLCLWVEGLRDDGLSAVGSWICSRMLFDE